MNVESPGRWAARVLGRCAAIVVLAGCAADPPSPPEVTTIEAPIAAPSPSPAAITPAVATRGLHPILIGWGAGPRQLGLRPAAPELPAEGPSSIAVGPKGDLLILDRLNERVVAIDPEGAARVIAEVPRDAEHLAAGPDGALAAWSPLRATVWLRAESGAPAGDLEVPRILREIQSFGLGESRRVLLTTPYQETLDLGSPQAPHPLDAVLRSKREGAVFLPDGRGVAARRLPDHRAELLVYAVRGARSAEPILRHPIPGPIDAVRLIGAADTTVCLRLERVTSTPAITVEREALCLDALDGRARLRVDLRPPGLYTLHRDLAFGGSPPLLAAVSPDASGLLVQRWQLEERADAEVPR